MANSVYVSHFDQLEKVFKEIPNAIEQIVKDIDKNDKQKTSLPLAQDLAQTIQKRYTDYLNRISDYEHGTKNVTVVINNTKKGYVVKIYGKDVLYHEYGTGTRGLQNKHPRHNADGMKPYGSGRNIIHNGKKNGSDETPYWYKMYRDFPGGVSSKRESVNYNFPKTDFGNEPIKSSDYVWRHNNIITKGLPAGRFVYDSCNELRSRGGLANKTVLMNSIKQAIKTDFKDRLNRTIRQRKVTKPPEIRTKMPSSEEFQRRLLGKLLSQKEGL